MELNKEQALNRASGLCVKSEHCESDIRLKLRQWNVPSCDVDDVIEQLKKHKFIDEQRYARAFVREKSKFNKWGEIKIKHALYAKGIDDETINEALEENIDKDSESENLVALLKNKRKSIKDDDRQAVRVKLIRFAASRGYSMDQISKALKEVL
ncbi:MAG: regulatory protein RecX [Paludibacteraceae bacterium]|nr:regulatory protein RecX [Paludibacteraceae bacterium]